MMEVFWWRASEHYISKAAREEQNYYLGEEKNWNSFIQHEDASAVSQCSSGEKEKISEISWKSACEPTHLPYSRPLYVFNAMLTWFCVIEFWNFEEMGKVLVTYWDLFQAVTLVVPDPIKVGMGEFVTEPYSCLTRSV